MFPYFKEKSGHKNSRPSVDITYGVTIGKISIMDGAMKYSSKAFDIEQDKKIDLQGIPEGVADIDYGVLREAVDRAPLVIFAVESTGTVKFINQEAMALLGQDATSAEIPAGDILTPAHPEKWAEISSGLTERGFWRGELLVRGRSGSTLMLELSAMRIFESDEGNSFTDFYIGRDVSDEKKRERDAFIQERLATRAEMAGEISHELNNFLSIVLGNLELMSMNIDRGKFDGLAGRIKSVREGMTRMAGFVQGLMAVQKPEIKRDRIEPSKILEDEVFYFKSIPKYQDIEFVCNWGDNLPVITGERNRLQHAIYNILLNAAEALTEGNTENKKISISVSRSMPDDTIKIEIADNGCGMSQENYQRLFRQFFSTKGQGRGFGLLAVKGAIKSFSGKVSAAPGPDGGACFNIMIPAQKSEQPSAKPIMASA